MTDILSTELNYEVVCKELDTAPHPYLTLMIQQEKADYALEYKSGMHLYLAGNNKLLCEKRFKDKHCKLLAIFLSRCPYITSLDLRYNRIGDLGAQILARMLSENEAIQELNLMCNDIGPTGASALAKSLYTNASLRKLRINGNKIEVKALKGAMSFAQALQINTTLECLDIGDTDMRTETTIGFATVLLYNNTVKSLNVNRPILFGIMEESTVHYANMLKANDTIEELHLRKYDMRDYGAGLLAENLTRNSSLLHLDIALNRVTRDGALEFARLLQRNTPLQILDLGYNRIEDDGAMHLADALASNTTLQCLAIESNNIKGPGLCAIAKAMETNVTLAKIFIWGNELEQSACTAFANLIKSGRLLKQDTDVQPYTVGDRIYLAQLNNSIERHYYYGGIYGDDVPDWQERGLNPRRLVDPTLTHGHRYNNPDASDNEQP